MGYIYKITNNINGKIYIGKTNFLKPEDRWKQHLREAKRKRCEKRPLYSAINKYGKDNFNFEVVEQTDNTEEREKFWIYNLRTYVGFDDCKGYNATLGGDGKSRLNLDDKDVIKKYFELRSSEKVAEYYYVSPKTILMILHNNNIDVNLAKYPILKIDQYTYEIIEKIEYVKDIKTILQTDDYIKCLLTTVCKPWFGYLWIYENDYKELGKNGIDEIKQKSAYYGNGKYNLRNPQKVICINDNKIFESESEGMRYYNIKSNGGISECCSGKKRSCGKHPVTGKGLVWMYYNDYLQLSKDSIENILNGIHNTTTRSGGKMIKVICLTTMKVFDSITNAGRFYNVDKSQISACCKGKLKSAGKLSDGTKLKWQYYKE